MIGNVRYAHPEYVDTSIPNSLLWDTGIPEYEKLLLIYSISFINQCNTLEQLINKILQIDDGAGNKYNDIVNTFNIMKQFGYINKVDDRVYFQGCRFNHVIDEANEL